MITVKSSDSFVTNQSSTLSAIGQSLKQARLDCSLSLDEVAAKTHISVRYLRAIEEGALDDLPEAVYVRGFLRRYCDAVSTADLSDGFPVTVADCQKQWHNAPSTELRPLHLYALYVAVVMGTVTALASFLTPPQTVKITDSETKFGKSAQLEPNNSKNPKSKRGRWVPTLEGIEVLRQSGNQFALADGNSLAGGSRNGGASSGNANNADGGANNLANNAIFSATGDITSFNGSSQSMTAQIFSRVVSRANPQPANPSQASVVASRNQNNTNNVNNAANGTKVSESFTEANVGLGVFLNDWSSKTTITRATNEEQVAGNFEFSPNKPVNVGIITTGASWLRVLVDGKTVFEGVAPEGKQFSWSGDQRISVRAGNAGAVMLAFNSNNARRLGKEGDVIEKRFGDEADGGRNSQNRVSNSVSANLGMVPNDGISNSGSVVESSVRTFR